MKQIIKRVAVIAGGALLLAPFLAGAVTNWNGGIQGVTPNAQFNINTFVTLVLSWAFGLLIVIAVLLVIYAAFLYLTAAGEEEKIKKAKNYIVYAVVALVVAAISQALIAIVRSFLQATNT